MFFPGEITICQDFFPFCSLNLSREFPSDVKGDIPIFFWISQWILGIFQCLVIFIFPSSHGLRPIPAVFLHHFGISRTFLRNFPWIFHGFRDFPWIFHGFSMDFARQLTSRVFHIDGELRVNGRTVEPWRLRPRVVWDPGDPGGPGGLAVGDIL